LLRIIHAGLISNIKHIAIAIFIFAQSKEKKGGDLARFIGLNDGLVAVEPSVNFPICSNFANIVIFEKGQFKGECNTNGTKAIFIGGSFRTNLYPFIAQSVEKIVRLILPLFYTFELFQVLPPQNEQYMTQ